MVEGKMLPSMPVLFSKESQDAFVENRDNNSALTAIQKECGESALACRGCQCSDRGDKDWREELPMETEDDINEMTLVASYYAKVQARFACDPPHHNRALLFQQLLQRFDPHKESPVELYRRVEALFGAEGAELSEEFVLFLTQAQAARAGRLADLLHLAHLLKFTALLQRELRHKEALLRRVVRALGAGPAGPGAGAAQGAEWAARVSSLLRAAPRLHHAFTRLLPAHRPAQHAHDAGKEDRIELRGGEGGEELGAAESWELPEPPEEPAPAGAGGAHPQVTYMHGRVLLQCGRTLRGARVSFLGSGAARGARYHARRLAPPHLPPHHAEPPAPPPARRPQNRQPSAGTRKRKKTKLSDSEGKEARDGDAAEAAVKQNETKPQDVTSPGTDGPKVTHLMKVAEIDNTRLKIVKVEPLDEQGKSPIQDNKHTPKLANNKDCSVNKKERKYKDPNDIKIETIDNLKREMLEIIAAEKSSSEIKPNDLTRVNLPETDKDKKDNIESVKDLSNEPKEQPYEMTTKPNHGSQHWTRNEDKIILEVLKGEISSEKTFEKIRELLPNRTVAEIQARFQHVMSLLQEMAASDVATSSGDTGAPPVRHEPSARDGC